MAAEASAGGKLILDLTGIVALDSDGVRAIVEAVGQAEVAGARVELRAGEVVQRVATREGLGGAIGF